MDKGQIDNYDLSESLDAKTPIYWEKISVARRLIHTHVFRNNSSFTTFICEDLARSDPAHETVRALGPSIVFCLLMDGPQIGTRWSARYALGLVEAPGSAVLTFTSRGLMQRTRNRALRVERDEDASKRAKGEAYPRAENWSVGLWRDLEKGPKELHCPPPDHAIVLELKQADKIDHSYDGRINHYGVSWRYESSRTIRLNEEDVALLG